MTRTADVERLLAQADWLRALARRLVGNAAADDVVQETLIAAIDAPPDQAREPRPWLARIARNVTRMQFRSASRRARREEAVAEPAEVRSPQAIVERLETHRALTELVLGLDEPYRSTLVRHYFDGRTLAELSREDGVPEGTVRWRHKQAIDRLRTQLDERAGGDRRAWVATLAPIAGGGAHTSWIVGGLVVNKLVIGAIVIAAAGAIWWTAKQPATSAAPAAVAGSAALPGRAASAPAAVTPAAPRHVTQLASVAERRAIADRIASARTVRNVPAGPAPKLPALSADDIDDFKTTIKSSMREVIPYLTQCYEDSRPQLGSQIRVQARLMLTGDHDVGTLIDAQSLADATGNPLPPKFDDCVRSTLQTLELPPLAEGDEIAVNYPFVFADHEPDE